MEPPIVDRLRCPVCSGPLAAGTAGTARALRCPRGHSFDVARQGYVDLLAGRAPHSGDSAAMVTARQEFLAAGHYDVISSALAQAAGDALSRAAPMAYPLVVEPGAGTGRHLAAVLAALPGTLGLALDVSKPAVRRAARVHPRAGAALADTWRRLPLADASAALLLNVFAPRNGSEFRRVLDPTGALLVVTPAEEHLTELVGALDLLRVDPAKADRVAASLAGSFAEVTTAVHRTRLALSTTEVRTLVGMGPSAWHTDPAGLAARVGALAQPVRVTVAVRLGVYRPC